MAEIDIQELEKALTPKKREKKPGRKEKELPKTKQALLDEAKRLNEEMDALGYRELSSRHGGNTWSFDRRGSRNIVYTPLRGSKWDHHQVENIGDIPDEVLKRMVRNGRKRLREFHSQVNSLIEANPNEALESNLEGKTGMDVISFIYNKKEGQLGRILNSLITSPVETKLWLEFNVELGFGPADITYYGHRGGRVSINNIDAYPRRPKEVKKTVDFLNNFDQVIEKVKSQVSQIKIEEVTK